MSKSEHQYKPVLVRKYAWPAGSDKVFIDVKCDCGKKDYRVKLEEELTNEEKEIYERPKA